MTFNWDATNHTYRGVTAGVTSPAATTPEQRLEAIRASLRAQNVSYGELAELQSLAPYIAHGDVELLEAAGVPEFEPVTVCESCGGPTKGGNDLCNSCIDSQHSTARRSHQEVRAMSTGVVLDWDGTLHEHAGYRPGRFGNVDLSLVDEAFDRGFTVAVSTCNDVWRIAEYLEDAGYQVCADVTMRDRLGQCGWDGGGHRYSGRLILVTNLKVSGYLIDDRAFNYHYGFPTDGVWAQVEDAEYAKRHGYPKQSRENRKQRHISRHVCQDPAYGPCPRPECGRVRT